MGKSSKVGSAHVDITAKTDKLEKDLKNAESSVHQSTSKMGKSAEKNIGGAMSAIGDAATRLQAIVSKLFIPLTIVASILAIVSKFQEATKAARNFQRAAKDIAQDAKDRVALLNAESGEMVTQVELIRRQSAERKLLDDKIDEAIAEHSGGFRQLARLVHSAFTDAPVTTSEKLAVIAKEQVSLFQAQVEEQNKLRKLAEDRAASEAKIAESARQSAAEGIRAQIEAMDRSLKTPIEQIKLRYADLYAEIEELSDQLSESEVENFKRVIDARKKLEIDAIFEAESVRRKAESDRLQREQQAIRDRERREQQAAERTAQSLERAISSAFDKLDNRAASLNDATSSTLGALLQRIEIFIDNQGMG